MNKVPVTQAYEIVNNIFQEATGESSILTEDLSNIVDVGGQIFDKLKYDGYLKSLINQIGKIIFVNRKYTPQSYGIEKDAWEYGSALMKVYIKDLPEAEENPSWELTNGRSYDPNVFRDTVSVNSKFYNNKDTFMIQASIATEQVKMSMQSAENLMAFIAMVMNYIELAYYKRVEEIQKRTITNYIGDVIKHEYDGAALNTKSTKLCRNLLYEYNQKFGKDLSVNVALEDPEFAKYLASELQILTDYLTEIRNDYNMEGSLKHTPKEMQKLIMLSNVKSKLDNYTYTSLRHPEYLSKIDCNYINAWQTIEMPGQIKVKTASNNVIDTGDAIVLGCLFDRDALGVSNLGTRIETEFVKVGNFTNYWFFADFGLWCDYAENFIVLIIA